MNLFSAALFSLFAILVVPLTLQSAFAEEPSYILNFTKRADTPVEPWLESKGFVFEQDAKNRKSVALDTDEEGLEITANKRVFGIMPNEAVNLSTFSRIEIDWGVDVFPEGASYEQNVRNEAIMLMVFMGDELKPSGSVFIPNSPYFIGLFLCDGDTRVGHPYVGEYFKKGGRYVCLEKPEPGTTVTTSFDLFGAYRNFFDKEDDDDPGISGIALALDTKKSGNRGQSQAFIREIRFYE